MHISGRGAPATLYTPLQKNHSFIASLQPQHVYSFAVNLIYNKPWPIAGVFQQELPSFIETTPSSIDRK